MLPVLRARSPHRLIEVVNVLASAGVTAVELTMTTPGALDVVSALRTKHGDAVLIGMGSVLSKDAAARAADSGAQFLVSPVRVNGLADFAHAAGIPFVPGALTPHELHRCDNDKPSLSKLFPASSVGPRYLAEVLAPMPHLSIMPSGGVTLAAIGEWRLAGAFVVSLGGSLLGDALDDGNLRALATRARRALDTWNETRQ